MSVSNKEIIRGPITTPIIGTVGDGLSGPDQFEAFFALAREQVRYLDIMGTHRTNALTGVLPRIDFANDLIESADEAVDTGNFFEPIHDSVPFTLTKTRFAAKVGNDSLKFNVQGPAYEDTLNTEASKAWGRAVLRLLWQGDVLSADTSLNINNGWAQQIAANGVTVAGGAINGGNFTIEHLDTALQALPEANAEDLDDGYSWVMTKLKFLELSEVISNRATGMGDNILTTGTNGIKLLKDLPIEIVGFVGNSVYLVKPDDTMMVTDRDEFSLKRVQGGQLDIDDVFVLLSFMWLDPIIREVEGTVVIDGLL